MEGRYPSGLMLGITNCNDPSKEDEFNYWHKHIHLPDVTAPGVFRHAIRFVNTNPKPGEGKYLATYETDHSDPGKAADELLKLRANWEHRGRLLGATDLVFRITARRIWPMD